MQVLSRSTKQLLGTLVNMQIKLFAYWYKMFSGQNLFLSIFPENPAVEGEKISHKEPHQLWHPCSSSYLENHVIIL